MIDKISAQEAKRIMDSNNNLAIGNVRNEDEYLEGHIQNALLLPLPTIQEKTKEVLKES